MPALPPYALFLLALWRAFFVNCVVQLSHVRWHAPSLHALFSRIRIQIAAKIYVFNERAMSALPPYALLGRCYLTIRTGLFFTNLPPFIIYDNGIKLGLFQVFLKDSKFRKIQDLGCWFKYE
jgi:hypothetical protein